MPRYMTVWGFFLACTLGLATAVGQQGLVVEVVDPEHPGTTVTLAPELPPILVEGKQVASVDALRKWLLERAAPGRFPDPAMTIPPGHSVSRLALIVRCDPGQSFGWLQVVLHAATFVPGEDRGRALRESPLMRHVRLELRGSDRVAELTLPLDASQLLSNQSGMATLNLRVGPKEINKPLHDRGVKILRDGQEEPLGEIKGLDLLNTRPPPFLVQVPSSTLGRARVYCAAESKKSKVSLGRLIADPGVPFVVAFEFLRAMEHAGLTARYVKALDAEEHGAVLERRVGVARPRRFYPLGLPGGVPSVTAAIGVGPRRTGPYSSRANVRSLRELKSMGGGAKTQDAADLGLDWLARHQAPDGLWLARTFPVTCSKEDLPPCEGSALYDHDVGVTALALLAFLARGETHEYGAKKDVVQKGLAALLTRQDATGCFGQPSSPHISYPQALASLALVEAFGMTEDSRLRDPAQRAIDFILKMQNPYAAWRYGVRPKENDVSVTSWMIQALVAAQKSKLVVPNESLTYAMELIVSMTDEETGRTGYRKRGERPSRVEGALDKWPAEMSESLTAAAMFCRILTGRDLKSDPMLVAGQELLLKRRPVWDTSSGSIDMYYWYHGTLAMFQLGGSGWKAWNSSMMSAVIDSQCQNGCAKGSWDPVGPWGQDAGRVYSTALMTLCLEVYYRYERVTTRK